MKVNLLALALVTMLMAVSPIEAHHGASEFDPHSEVTLRGTVRSFVFSNPHVQIFFDATGSRDEKVAWQGELPAPNTLLCLGWNRKSLRTGDSITLTGLAAWHGVHSMWIRKLIADDGRELPLSGRCSE